MPRRRERPADAAAAKRALRKRPCLCGKGGYLGPHEEGCPKRIDRSPMLKVRQRVAEVRHPEGEGEWLTLAEFNRIDLFAFRRWLDFPDADLKARSGIPGRFYRRVAYEIKVSRSDWRSEMRKPQKRAGAMALTHQFFFAVPDGLVRRDEVPVDCGLVTVAEDGAVKTVKHAPIRRPTVGLTTGDVVALLSAQHLGSNTWEVRREADSLRSKIRDREADWRQHDDMLMRARRSMIRTHGHLLVAGSDWVGPWPWRPFPANKKVRESVPVRVTSVNVSGQYDDPETSTFIAAYNGTVHVKPIDEIERDGVVLGGEWVDPGDFLIAYRHVSDPVKPPPPRSDLDRPVRRELRVLDGGD